MKKIYLSAMMLASVLLSSAQAPVVSSVQKVNLPAGVIAEQPVISPDGSKIAFGNNGAVQTLDLASGKLTTVTDNGMAFDLKFTEDGQNLVFRQKTYNKNGLGYTSLKSANLSSGAQTELVKATRNLEAVNINGTSVATVEKGKLRTKNLGAAKFEAKPTVGINRGHLAVTVNGKTTNIDPQGRSSYLWPALSPDGKKIVYYAAYLGCFVCDLDGSNPVSLGNLRAAKWLDNNTVVGMRDADNGDYVTESVVIAKSLEGKETKLTPETMIAMYPTATADGKKVAFSTVQGEVYVINLK